MKNRGWLGMLLGVLVLCTTSGCAVVIEDGHAGLRANFGKFEEQPLATGLHWFVPMISWIEVWEIKAQNIKEIANVPSSEGLISQLDVSVIFNVPAEKVVHVRRTIGRRYMDTVLEPYVREAIRNIVSGYPVKALYSDAGRKEIGEKILAFLKERVEPRGIFVQDVLLRDVKLPPSFAQSIEQKLRAEQEALQKEFELAKAKKDAEIEVARAQGVAQSNQIIANSISESYLRYRWIEGLQTNQMMVIYVPTEANLPIMEAGRWGDIQQYMKNPPSIGKRE